MGRYGLVERAEALGARVTCSTWTGPPDGGSWPGRPWPRARTCSAWPAATGPRPWWPPWPPSTGCPSWSWRPVPATTSPWTSAWTVTTPPRAWTPSRTAWNSASTWETWPAGPSSTTPRSARTRNRAEPRIPRGQGGHGARPAARPAAGQGGRHLTARADDEAGVPAGPAGQQQPLRARRSPDRRTPPAARHGQARGDLGPGRGRSPGRRTVRCRRRASGLTTLTPAGSSSRRTRR